MLARDEGVSAVLGALLMLAILMTLVPGLILMRDAIADEMEAQREAAERAAWCARNPSIGPPTCEDAGPLPGYDCREVELHTWLCTRETPDPTRDDPPLPPPTIPTAP